MNVRRLAAVVIAGVFTFLGAVVAPSRAASVMFDVIPAPGSAPVRLHIAQTMSSPAGPQTVESVVELRRTGPATVALQRSTDIVPLVVTSDGALRLDPAAPAGDDVRGLVAVIDMAHGVTGVAGAGDRAGWTAIVPLPAASPAGAVPPPAPAASPSPAAPLILPVHTFDASVAGTFDLDGSTQTTLAPPSTGAPRSQRSRGGGGGFGGGFGGFGRGGGFGGGRGGGDEGAPRGVGGPPVTLDLHVAGHVAHAALARLTITQTRSVVLNGLTYSNIDAVTIDVLK